MHDYSPEDIKRDSEATNRANSRIESGNLLGSNVNSYIAALTDHARAPLTPPEVKESLEKAIGMFAYLRDNFGSQTVGESMKAMSERKVDPKIIELWISEGMAVNPLEYNSISMGYPEFIGNLKKARDEAFRKE